MSRSWAPRRLIPECWPLWGPDFLYVNLDKWLLEMQHPLPMHAGYKYVECNWKLRTNFGHEFHTKTRNKKFWEELFAYIPWYDTGHIENDAFNNSIVACVFITAVTFLPSRCLATIRGFLLSRCLGTIRWYTYRHTDWWEGFLIRPLRWA
jgi:hypothetical protein